MKIIIVGCGKVGTTLAEHLYREGHDITIIDKHNEKLTRISERIDVMGMEGNGASIITQREAGVEGSDLLIATTSSDELNLLCCLIAKKAGASHTIARIRDPEYYSEMRYIRDELNLSMVINPEQAAAAEIARIIKFPSAIKIDSFARGRLELIKLEIPKESKLDGMLLTEIEPQLHCKVLICLVERGEEVMIPHGDFKLSAGDKISFIASHKVAITFFKSAGAKISGNIHSLMLIGGGKVSYYVAKRLEDTNISVKIIERDASKCVMLSEMLPKAVIINGDGTDQSLLEEEGIGEVDCVATFTGIDEENILLSLYAAGKTEAKVITKINRITFEDVISDMNLGSIINPTGITSDNIVRYVRAMNNSMGSNVETLYKIASGRAEALEFRVSNDSADIVGKPLMQLKLNPYVIIAAINRMGKAITPNGQSTIEIGDTVIVVSTKTGLNNLGDILE